MVQKDYGISRSYPNVLFAHLDPVSDYCSVLLQKHLRDRRRNEAQTARLRGTQVGRLPAALHHAAVDRVRQVGGLQVLQRLLHAQPAAQAPGQAEAVQGRKGLREHLQGGLLHGDLGVRVLRGGQAAAVRDARAGQRVVAQLLRGLPVHAVPAGDDVLLLPEPVLPHGVGDPNGGAAGQRLLRDVLPPHDDVADHLDRVHHELQQHRRALHDRDRQRGHLCGARAGAHRRGAGAAGAVGVRVHPGVVGVHAAVRVSVRDHRRGQPQDVPLRRRPDDATLLHDCDALGAGHPQLLLVRPAAAHGLQTRRRQAGHGGQAKG
mmetsp:Transcript_30103/g.34462  ORF Transcript_30103/g.34462 Transcript_30103/m.34462 type:complete len:319 (+) Transcript_30103:79-1035(+)